jgi:hypothetical protein
MDWTAEVSDCICRVQSLMAMQTVCTRTCGSINSRDDVIRHAQDIWQNDPQMTEMCFACVSSMTSRIQQVIHNHGQSCFH